MNREELDSIFEQFNSLKALIVGDVMIDSYMWGETTRMSPEAPVPIVAVSKKENRLGGAANVALNVQSLGATPILCSIIGNDNAGQEVIRLLENQQLSGAGMVTDSDRPTTVKTRVIAADKHALRVDEEVETDISPTKEDELFNRISELIKSEEPQVVIFEDYNKGVLTHSLIQKTIKHCEKFQIPTIADPKKKNFLSYKNITLFKPNLKELNEGLNISVDPSNEESIKSGFCALHDHLKYTNALVTLSEYGIAIDRNGNSFFQDAYKRNILDVSGAGDTVLSTAALCLALHIPKEILATLSNLAGGLVCEKVGVVPIDKAQLLQEAINQIKS